MSGAQEREAAEAAQADGRSLVEVVSSIIERHIQFKTFGKLLKSGDWVMSGQEYDLLSSSCQDAARAILAVLPPPQPALSVDAEMLGVLCAAILEHDAGGITLATAREMREVIARAEAVQATAPAPAALPANRKFYLSQTWSARLRNDGEWEPAFQISGNGISSSPFSHSDAAREMARFWAENLDRVRPEEPLFFINAPFELDMPATLSQTPSSGGEIEPSGEVRS